MNTIPLDTNRQYKLKPEPEVPGPVKDTILQYLCVRHMHD